MSDLTYYNITVYKNNIYLRLLFLVLKQTVQIFQPAVMQLILRQKAQIKLLMSLLQSTRYLLNRHIIRVILSMMLATLLQL